MSSSPAPIHRLQYLLHAHPTVAPALTLAGAIATFTLIVGDRFIHPFNLSLILQQVTIIGILAAAQTLIILTAGIDLSVGAVMVLSSVIMGQMGVTLGLPGWLAVLIGIGAGAACGLANAVLVARLRLPPFIVTLGTWNIFFALNLWYSQSETIRSQDVRDTAPFLQWTGEIALDLFGAKIPVGSLLLVFLFTLLWFILRHTAWGRHVYAVGDSPQAARLSGINANRILISVYVVAGAICAIAGWALIGRIGAVSPQAGVTANLDSITAVVIGGTSLFGGRGAIFGTLIGALAVGVFRNGLALAGVDVLWQEFTVGALIIIAVATDQWLRRPPT